MQIRIWAYSIGEEAIWKDKALHVVAVVDPRHVVTRLPEAGVLAEVHLHCVSMWFYSRKTFRWI